MTNISMISGEQIKHRVTEDTEFSILLFIDIFKSTHAYIHIEDFIQFYFLRVLRDSVFK